MNDTTTQEAGPMTEMTCQCGDATGEACTEAGEISVDYCPPENAGTAAAAGSWAGLTVNLLVSTACAETLRTLYDDDGDTTTYPDPYTYAAARDGRVKGESLLQDFRLYSLCMILAAARAEAAEAAEAADDGRAKGES